MTKNKRLNKRFTEFVKDFLRRGFVIENMGNGTIEFVKGENHYKLTVVEKGANRHVIVVESEDKVLNRIRVSSCVRDYVEQQPIGKFIWLEPLTVVCSELFTTTAICAEDIVGDDGLVLRYKLEFRPHNTFENPSFVSSIGRYKVF